MAATTAVAAAAGRWLLSETAKGITITPPAAINAAISVAATVRVLCRINTKHADNHTSKIGRLVNSSSNRGV